MPKPGNSGSSIIARGWKRAWYTVLALLASCTTHPERIELSTLAQGEWSVRGVGSEGAVLTRGGDVAILRDGLEPVTAKPLKLTVRDSSITVFDAGGVYFSPTSPPQVVRSPAHAHRYAIEHDDAIWLFAAPDTFVKLTTDDDLATLRARQREGEVILYWSTHPVWSGDGNYISFITNRESVRGGSARQSLWLIDVASKRQRPLHAPAHAAVHTEGVLRDRFVFNSDRVPGVLAVKPTSGAVQRVSPGFVLAAHPSGLGVLIATGDPARRSLFIHREQDRFRALPMPAAGFVWSTQAQFSPNGERLAVVATNGNGAYRMYVFDMNREESLSVDMPGGPSTLPTWVSESALVFASRRPNETARTWLADLK